jgi:hypothetical protein
MLDFCGNLKKTALTDSDLTALYSNRTQTGLLGGQGGAPTILGSVDIQASDRDTNSLILPDVLPRLIMTLQQKGALPTPPDFKSGKEQSARVNAFMKEEAAAIDNIKKEICFYNSRYQLSLNNLIIKLQSGYSSSDDANKTQVNAKLEVTVQLNRKLNDLIQIMNEFTKTRLAQSQSYNESINSLNKSLLEKSKVLSDQNSILTSGRADALLYKEMVKYTKQKTNYTNNMLMLYSFLNITALGLLFYAYVNAEE